MANPPDELPRWADTGSAFRPEPADAKKDIGWENTGVDIPTAGTTNWLLWKIYEWLTNLAGSSAHYDTLEDAVDGSATVRALDVGETCVIDEADTDQEPGSVAAGSINVNNIISADVTGRSVIFAHTATGAAHTRDLSTVIVVYTPTIGGNISRIISDGTWTVICAGTEVELFDHDTGVSQWSYDHGGNVQDICMDGTNVYMVGAESVAGPTDNTHVRALTIAAGAATWSIPHSAPAAGDVLYSCATDGLRLFVSGDASTFATGAKLRALRADNGADTTGECVLADTTLVTWDAVPAATCSLNEQLATDGRQLYCGYLNSGNPEFEIRGAADGVQLQTWNHATHGVTSVTVDQTFVYILATNGAIAEVLAFDKKSFAVAWKAFHFVAAAQEDIYSIASDGAALYGGCEQTAAHDNMLRWYRGNRAQIWRRVDTADDYLPYRQMIIPEE